MEILEEVEQLLEHILLLVVVALVEQVLLLVLVQVLVVKVAMANQSQDLNILLLD